MMNKSESLCNANVLVCPRVVY